MSENIKVYTSFSGADMIISIKENKNAELKCIGEISSLRYNSLKKEIEMDVCMFTDINITEEFLTSLNNAEIIQTFANEEGFAFERKYLGVTFKGINVNTTVEDKCIKDTYVFECSDGITPLRTKRDESILLENKEKEN